MLSPTRRFEISIKIQWEALKEGIDCVVEHFQNLLYIRYILSMVKIAKCPEISKTVMLSPTRRFEISI